jgi:hypothetical protein
MASDDSLPDFSDIDIFAMKLELEHKKTLQLLDTMRTIVNWGSAASPLVPDLIKHYRLGKLHGSEPDLVDIWLNTGSEPLLSLLREYEIVFRANISQRCRLLEAGVQEVEKTLIKDLYEQVTCRNEYSCDIPSTLGRSGGYESYKLIRVLLPTIAEMVNVYEVSHSEGMPSIEGLVESEQQAEERFEAMNHGAHTRFLDVLREALRTLEARGMHQPGKNQ